MSLVMLQAMASGLPAAAADVSGSGEALGETGFLASPDPQSLAEALDRVAGDAGLRAELAACSLLRVQKYSWPRYTARLEHLYEELLA